MKIILYVWIYKLWSVPIEKAVGDLISKIFIKCSPLVFIFASEARRRKWDLFKSSNLQLSNEMMRSELHNEVEIVLVQEKAIIWNCHIWCIRNCSLIICPKTNKGDFFVSLNVTPCRFRAGWSDLPSPTLPHPSRGQVSLSPVQSHLPFCARARQLMMYSVTDPLGHIQFEAQHFAGFHLSLEERLWYNAWWLYLPFNIYLCHLTFISSSAG